MKGDDKRAEQLAAFLDGGPVPDDLEPLLPAVKRVRDVLRSLAPDPERVATLLPRLYREYLGSQEPVAVELAHPTLYVRSMEATLGFYRDLLGLTARTIGRRFSQLESGGAAIALQWTGSASRRAHAGDVVFEFRTADLDRTVGILRQRGLQVAVGSDERGSYAELHDPDGHTVRLTGPMPARAGLRDDDGPRSTVAREESND
jgi:catechol 2,3-dioxygenase-like lactoylglutathione lyase family enzyme